jgi:hypothetical protein
MITVQTKITDEQFKDMLCCACEGGSNYWIEKVDIESRPKQAEYWHESPVYGGHLAFHISEDEPIKDKGSVYKLTKDNLEKGAQIMADKYPHHFADWMNDNSDAITGDVFLQCCLFGEAIFG